MGNVCFCGTTSTSPDQPEAASAKAPPQGATKRPATPPSSQGTSQEPSPKPKPRPKAKPKPNPYDWAPPPGQQHAASRGGGGATAARVLDGVVPHHPRLRVTDKYHLGRELGRGEFGVTRLATDRATRERLACKSIPKRRLRTAVDVTDVWHEVAIMVL